jgi:hypothetical protein
MEQTKEGETQFQRLMDAIAGIQVFASESGDSYMKISTENHEEIWLIESEYAIQFLMTTYLNKYRKLPDPKSIDSIIRLMSFRAKQASPREKVYFRVATYDETTLLDLGDENWRVIEISKSGWQIKDRSPVNFYRTKGVHPFCIASKNDWSNPEDIHLLRKLLNLESQDDFVLILAFCFGVLSCSKNYPILILQGSQGAAKTTTSEFLKSLLDPGSPILRSAPTKEEDMFIAARQAHVLCLDNLSGLPPWASDALCKISTSGSFAKRKLYSNFDESVIELAKPTIVNGIDDLTTRPDLADRSIVLHLPHIKDSERRSSKVIRQEFEDSKQKIFHCLLDALAFGLSRKDSIQLKQKPRMADFAQLACACLEYFGIPAEVTNQLLLENRNQVSKDVVDMNSVGRRVLWFMSEKTFWQGTPTELHNQLSLSAIEQSPERDYSYPKTPQALSRELGRISPALRAYQLQVESLRGAGGRQIILRKIQIPPTNVTIATFASETNFDVSGGGLQ